MLKLDYQKSIGAERGTKEGRYVMQGEKESNVNDLWLKYTATRCDSVVVCGLCDNSGIIRTALLPWGRFCICPNGREAKKIAKKTIRK
jgi:hypothetical protein